MTEHKKLMIKDLQVVYSEEKENLFYLTVTLSDGENSDSLWYEIDKKYENLVCTDRIDGIVVSVFLTAMKFGYRVISSDLPISRDLYYNLKYQIIPQYKDLTGGSFDLELNLPVIYEEYSPSGVAAGMSRGVDSFATMYEYGKDFEMDDYKITHYTYFNSGAHHGRDRLVGKSKYTRDDLYGVQMEHTVEFCKQYGLELIIINSNLAAVLSGKKLFGSWSFNRTHTFRNLGIAMLLQKGIGKYFYSPAHNLSEFKFEIETDCGHYEKWLIRHLATENIEFFNSNQEWSRMEKVKRIAELEESYDHLNVCLVDDVNCGKCIKCRRTLMELDALGDDVLDKYAASFVLDKYKENDREKWFKDIWTLKENGNPESQFFEEIFVQASKTHPELLTVPLSRDGNSRKFLAVIKMKAVEIKTFPSKEAPSSAVAAKGDTFEIEGSWMNWYAVKVNEASTGYVHEDDIRLIDKNKAKRFVKRGMKAVKRRINK